MTEKNIKINEAAYLGRKIEFWEFIRKYAEKLMRFALSKVTGYTAEQDELLNDVAAVAMITFET